MLRGQGLINSMRNVFSPLTIASSLDAGEPLEQKPVPPPADLLHLEQISFLFKPTYFYNISLSFMLSSN